MHQTGHLRHSDERVENEREDDPRRGRHLPIQPQPSGKAAGHGETQPQKDGKVPFDQEDHATAALLRAVNLPPNGEGPELARAEDADLRESGEAANG